MYSPLKLLVALLPATGFCAPEQKRATLPPKWSVKLIGNNTSTMPNIYRDGGGGGKINNLNFINFADGTITTGGHPRDDGSNTKAFISNSIVLTEWHGGGPEAFFEFGSNGVPTQQVPFFSGENNYGIWPDSNIATLCGGSCGIAFYPVVDRSNSNKYVYGTAVNISVGFAPVVSRPVKALFSQNELGYGLFSSLVGTDGNLYMFGDVSGTQNSNGLKMARCPPSGVFDRSTYQYWNGAAWSKTIPPIDDGGKANIFNYSTTLINGDKLGPASGDVFWSNYYNVWMIIFQAVGINNNVYMVYSPHITGGWSAPVSLYATPVLNNYNYAIHAYPHYDETQKVIPISWTQQGVYTNPKGTALGYIAFANITFS